MAIIEVFPGSPTPIQDAVAIAHEGDVILVHKGTYHETVRIGSNKNNLRIVAKDKRQAVLDGRHILTVAISLNSVAGVEIDGFKIKNYISGGIRIEKGKSHPILENKISGISGRRGKGRPFGVFANQSAGNLLLRNNIKRIGTAQPGCGIQLIGSPGNWVIGNKLRDNSISGIVVSRGLHNAIVGNRISGNKSDGIVTSESDNTLIFDNKLNRNGKNGVLAGSTNNLILDSTLNNNRGNGATFAFNYNLALNNGIKNNRGSGLAVFSDFNDIQQNQIVSNGNNGVFIRAPHTANFVFENRFKDNKPRNIKDQGTNNNIVHNEWE
ncbi:nitrous oxide reductase family maturation protein NosD [Paenibacillus sp. GCM10027627]|uniref:right-handed parallel beta-helix repeat-containing protein n=1 Tax=unclassified Paenibacillus TaxID=185978 RepID=UPI003641E37D